MRSYLLTSQARRGHARHATIQCYPEDDVYGLFGQHDSMLAADSSSSHVNLLIANQERQTAVPGMRNHSVQHLPLPQSQAVDNLPNEAFMRSRSG